MARLIKVFLAVVLGCSGTLLVYGESIPLGSEGGTFTVSVLINDKIVLDFTLDSGAAEVSIPLDVFSTLRRTHTISDTDLLPSAVFTLADGSSQRQTRFRIRSLRVGGVELHDVVGSVAPPRGTLLLGQSFLSRLQSWAVDNRRHVLLINEGAATSAQPIQQQAPQTPQPQTPLTPVQQQIAAGACQYCAGIMARVAEDSTTVLRIQAKYPEHVMRNTPPDSPAFREAARTLRAINEEITRREQALVEGQKQPEAAKQ
jgi:hypothetical protein